MSESRIAEGVTEREGPEPGSPAWWEEQQPDWQRTLNRFCENWIFAFIIAMGIRLVFLEAYRIPTASMEPMLFGSENFGDGDFVLVDKFLFRFTGPERWGVTVFQYPVPEVVGPGGLAAPDVALDSQGRRTDNVFSRPLIHRNFVKRCVVMPDDVFYIANGDIHVQRQDGQWWVPPKPADLIEKIWQPIYRLGAEPDYLPWKGAATSTVSLSEAGQVLSLDLAEGEAVSFTQELWNLYIKQGDVAVEPRHGSGRAIRFDDVDLTHPIFNYKGEQGSVWNYDRWSPIRIKTEELDSQYNPRLNQAMDERVGDFRVAFSILQADAPVRFEQAEGDQQVLGLAVGADGWRLYRDQDIVAEGSEQGVGPWAFVNLDDRVWAEFEGRRLCEPVAVAAVDPDLRSGRSELRWRGSGPVDLAGLAISRDVHYCRNGFLSDESDKFDRYRAAIDQRTMAAARAQADLDYLVRSRRMFIEALVDDELRQRYLEQMDAALAGRRAGKEWLGPIGDSPQTALRAPADAYLLLGDNSPFSLDSRNWGWVPSTNLRGTVLLAARLPFGRWQLVE